MCASSVSRVHSHACIRQYVQALRPVSGGVPGAPSPAQRLLELGDALLTINGARGDGVYRGCRGAEVQGCRGAGVQGCRGAGVQGCTGVAQEVEGVERVQGQQGRTGETAKGY